MKQLLLLNLLFTVLFSQAQLQRVCGHDDVMQKARQDNPQFDREYEQFLDQALRPENMHRLNDTVYQVQVVFHILYSNNDPYQNVSDSLVLSQLAAMNRDFNMLNPDTADTRPIFKDIAGNAKIEFVLARIKPNGKCGNGIIRKPFNAPANFLPIFTDFLIKEDLFGGSSAWNANKYLNIWVLDLNKGAVAGDGFLGGFAYFPGMTPVKYNGVVVDFRFFGQDNPYIYDVLPQFQRYNLGRACVHEVGHWFGLRHVWGDIGTLDPTLGCTADDGIDDTPNAAVAYATHGLCTDTIVNSCLDQPIDYPDMFENYMDYSTDSCQSMFTIDQVTVMRAALLNNRSDIIFTPTPNTTEVLYAEAIENQDNEICFEVGECFGYGQMIGSFCNSDSTYTSNLGEAILVDGVYCINYSAGTFDANSGVDSFCIVVQDVNLGEVDTTIIVVNIIEQCPKVNAVATTLVENTTATYCLDADGCLTGQSFELSFCGINGNYNSDLLNATANGECIEFTTNSYDANNTSEVICLIADYSNDIIDTTYLTVSIDEATSIDLVSSENNFIDVYPNPNNGVFTIHSQQRNNITTQLTIYNSIGDAIMQTNLAGQEERITLDISTYAKGVYLLFFEQEGVVSFEKVVVE